jgi:hypothetical protein
VPESEAEEQFPDRQPDIWYELSKDALDRQLSFVDAIDAKVGGFLGSGSALLGILVAVYALKLNAIKQMQTTFLICSVILYGILALASIATLMKREWGTGAKVRALESDAEKRGYSNNQIRWKAASTFLDDMEKNECWYRFKIWGLRVAVISLFLETVFVVSGLWTVVPR